MRGYGKAGVPAAIRAAGGAIFAITSEPQTLASEAQTSWELDLPALGDPHHEIADECRERGWLSLFVNRDTRLMGTHKRGAAHPNGYFQPGVLALSRRGRVLYRWRGRPTRSNAGGATHRPLPSRVWDQIQAALAELRETDAALDEPEQIDMQAPPWPLFVLMLLANGKFVRPEPFGLERRGPDDVGRRSRGALRNLALFVGGWVAAFALLPVMWALAAFAVWALAVTPGIVDMHRQFQSVPSGEPEE